MSAVENPPAFPQSRSSAGSFGGMDLRDWFAGQALQGAISCPTMREGMTSDRYALMAYQLADAMLAERVKAGAA